MVTSSRFTVHVALVASLAVQSGCNDDTAGRDATVEADILRRAILSCDLRPSASVVAFVSIGPERYVMTPAADGETASLTLTLTTGDPVLVEISYSVDGDPFVIARARVEVPSSGPLDLQESDFILVDADDNGVADCVELTLPTEPDAPRGLFVASGSENTVTTPGDARWSVRPTNTAGSTIATTMRYGGISGHALCAYDVDAAGRWYWRIPVRLGVVETRLEAPVLEFDFKLTNLRKNGPPPTLVLTDHSGTRWARPLESAPGTDWTRFSVPIDKATGWLPEAASGVRLGVTGLPDRTTGANNASDSGEWLYVPGDHASGTAGGSCIDNVVILSAAENRVWSAHVF